ncbi:MAG: hypothetical protein AAF743_00495 [Planctomycetota bacterium]
MTRTPDTILSPPTPMAAPEPIPEQKPEQPPTSQDRPRAAVPNSDLPEPPTSPKSRTRVNRDRPDFNSTPAIIKLGYLLAAAVLALMFIMAALSVLG